MTVIVGARLVIHEQVSGFLIRVACDDIPFTGFKSILKWKALSLLRSIETKGPRGKERVRASCHTFVS